MKFIYLHYLFILFIIIIPPTYLSIYFVYHYHPYTVSVFCCHVKTVSPMNEIFTMKSSVYLYNDIIRTKS